MQYVFFGLHDVLKVLTLRTEQSHSPIDQILARFHAHGLVTKLFEVRIRGRLNARLRKWRHWGFWQGWKPSMRTYPCQKPQWRHFLRRALSLPRIRTSKSYVISSDLNSAWNIVANSSIRSSKISDASDNFMPMGWMIVSTSSRLYSRQNSNQTILHLGVQPSRAQARLLETVGSNPSDSNNLACALDGCTPKCNIV
jgi:hypothetical protein